MTETLQRLYVSPPQQPIITNNYQIWSTVFNSALTEINNQGTKVKTKVFAGGAVIAEQNYDGSFGNVDWITADPVTGSSVRMRKSGAFYSSQRKEYEPLGQEVLPTINLHFCLYKKPVFSDTIDLLFANK